MANKRRRVQLFNVSDDLTCREWFMAFGRDVDDEVKLIISNGMVLRVEHHGHILTDIPDVKAARDGSPLMSYLWKWLAAKYSELNQEAL